MTLSIRTLSCALLLALAAPARAGFFIPKDTSMTMAMYSPDAQSAEVAHGVSRDLALAAGYHRYKSDDLSKDRRFLTVQASYLLSRRYDTDGVGNMYIFGGPVLARSSELPNGRTGWQAGLWGDYETRRVYLRASIQTHDAGPLRQMVSTAQTLWAPYPADYEDIATWFGVQLQRRNQLSDATQITPILRLFQRSWWLDAGASVNREHRGDVFINVMFLY